MRATLLGVLFLVACDPALTGDDDAGDDDAGDDDAGDDDAADDDDTPLFWWLSCGDPACSGWTASGDPMCLGTAEGDACTDEGSRCDPRNDCNAVLHCAATDPFPDPCPISARRFKDGIAYLDPAAVADLHAQVVGLPLATWTYDGGGLPRGSHLGYVLEDAPRAPATAGDHVDLYAYASMAIAAVQEQQRQIDALRAEVGALRAAALPAPAPAGPPSP